MIEYLEQLKDIQLEYLSQHISYDRDIVIKNISEQLKKDIDYLNKFKNINVISLHFNNIETIKRITNIFKRRLQLTGINSLSGNIPNESSHVNTWLEFVEYMGAGAEGQIIAGKLIGTNLKFAIKTSKNPNENNRDIGKEYFIYSLLNNLREIIPNFLLTFGMFNCSSISNKNTPPNNLFITEKNKKRIIPKGKDICNCVNSTNCIHRNFLITEYINSPIINTKVTSLQNYIEQKDQIIDINEIKSYILIIILSLKYATREYGFVHKDLNTRNISLVNIHKSDSIHKIIYNFEGKEYIFYIKYLPIILDFGGSIILKENNIPKNMLSDYNKIFPKQEINELLPLWNEFKKQPDQTSYKKLRNALLYKNDMIQFVLDDNIGIKTPQNIYDQLQQMKEGVPEIKAFSLDDNPVIQEPDELYKEDIKNMLDKLKVDFKNDKTDTILRYIKTLDNFTNIDTLIDNIYASMAKPDIHFTNEYRFGDNLKNNIEIDCNAIGGKEVCNILKDNYNTNRCRYNIETHICEEIKKSERPFYNKYIKYKSKYLYLKQKINNNQKGGGLLSNRIKNILDNFDIKKDVKNIFNDPTITDTTYINLNYEPKLLEFKAGYNDYANKDTIKCKNKDGSMDTMVYFNPGSWKDYVDIFNNIFPEQLPKCKTTPHTYNWVIIKNKYNNNYEIHYSLITTSDEIGVKHSSIIFYNLVYLTGELKIEYNNEWIYRFNLNSSKMGPTISKFISNNNLADSPNYQSIYWNLVYTLAKKIFNNIIMNKKNNIKIDESVFEEGPRKYTGGLHLYYSEEPKLCMKKEKIDELNIKAQENKLSSYNCIDYEKNINKDSSNIIEKDGIYKCRWD